MPPPHTRALPLPPSLAPRPALPSSLSCRPLTMHHDDKIDSARGREFDVRSPTFPRRCRRRVVRRFRMKLEIVTARRLRLSFSSHQRRRGGRRMGDGGALLSTTPPLPIPPLRPPPPSPRRHHRPRHRSTNPTTRRRGPCMTNKRVSGRAMRRTS